MANTIKNLASAFAPTINAKEKLKEYFHDTITEFETELSAEEIAIAFTEVLTENYLQASVEYKQAKELLEYFQK